MGLIFSKVWTRLFKLKEARILILGLEAAGKTTILYQLKLGQNVKTMPTFGFNVETIKYKKVSFTLWDVSGQYSMRKLVRKNYYENTQGIVYVVDWNDHERLDDSKEELYRILANDHLKDAWFLILANKQDVPDSISPEELIKRFDLYNLKDRDLHIQGIWAVTGDGLYEGFNWLSRNIKEMKK